MSGKATKQARNVRRELSDQLEKIKARLSVDTRNYITEMADTMAGTVIAGLMSMRLWKRFTFACTIIFMPIGKRIQAFFTRRPQENGDDLASEAKTSINQH